MKLEIGEKVLIDTGHEAEHAWQNANSYIKRVESDSYQALTVYYRGEPGVSYHKTFEEALKAFGPNAKVAV